MTWSHLHGTHMDMVLDTIRRRGMAKPSQIRAETELGTESVRRIIAAITRKGPLTAQRAHIAGWVREFVGKKFIPQPIVAIGVGANQKRPPPLGQTEVNRRYHAKRVAQIREDHPEATTTSQFIRRDFVPLAERRKQEAQRDEH